MEKRSKLLALVSTLFVLALSVFVFSKPLSTIDELKLNTLYVNVLSVLGIDEDTSKKENSNREM